MIDDIKDAINNMTKERIKHIINVIEEIGFITDEDKNSFTKPMLKHCGDYLVERLSEEGCEIPLEHSCKYYPNWGEVAVLYDSNVFKEWREMEIALDKYVETKVNNYGI